MITRSVYIFLTIISFWMIVGILPSGAGEDAFTSAFYTRGADTGYYIDSDDKGFNPLYVRVRRVAVLPRATLTATKEDNLFLNANATQGGTVIQLVPGMMFLYGKPDYRYLYLDYGIIIPLYDSSSQLLERPSHLLTLGFVYDTGKTKSDVRFGYRHTERVDTLVAARITQQDYIADADVEHKLSQKTSAGVLGHVEYLDFEQDAYTDYNRLYGAARLYHHLTGKSDVFGQAGFGRDDLDTPGNYGDAEFYDLSLGLRGKLTSKTSVNGRVGTMWRSYLDDRLEDVTHWIASIGAKSNPFGFTTFGLDLYSDIRPAVNAPGAASIDQRMTASAARRLLSERVRGNASIFAGRVDYRGTPDYTRWTGNENPSVFDGRSDDYWGYTLGLDWWLPRHLSVGLLYSYIEYMGRRDDNQEIGSPHAYDSGHWILRMSWNY